MRPYRYILSAALSALCALGSVGPAFAAGTVYLANGGQNFTAYGPSSYWRYDLGLGYCGNAGSWCSPRHSQWTYVNQTAGNVNWATWRNPAPVNYPEYASAFIPRRNATATAKYTLRYNYGSYQSAYLDQLPYYDQWVRLNSGGLAMLDQVMLGDQSYWGSASSKVAFDEIKIEN